MNKDTVKNEFIPANAAITRQMIYEDMFYDRNDDGVWRHDTGYREWKATFTAEQMPDHLCQQYVDDTYGHRNDFNHEDDFSEARNAQARKLRLRIVKWLKAQ